MSDNKKVKCDYCGIDTPQDKIFPWNQYSLCHYCFREGLEGEKETRWSPETYLALAAASPAMLEVVRWVDKHWDQIPRIILDKATNIINALQEAAERNGDEWEN